MFPFAEMIATFFGNCYLFFPFHSRHVFSFVFSCSCVRRENASEAKTRVYLAILSLFCTYAQVKFPYHIDKGMTMCWLWRFYDLAQSRICCFIVCRVSNFAVLVLISYLSLIFLCVCFSSRSRVQRFTVRWRGVVHGRAHRLYRQTGRRNPVATRAHRRKDRHHGSAVI